ncbi:hypothetical protein HK101_009803 [Irineochytrium annulatum]|nr:hypothetical protein HK101_009803 [Irineochytrium annulatum]
MRKARVLSVEFIKIHKQNNAMPGEDRLQEMHSQCYRRAKAINEERTSGWTDSDQAFVAKRFMKRLAALRKQANGLTK